MAQIKRYLAEKISQDLENKKILIIYGPRQVGKTTLAKTFLESEPASLYLNGDFVDDRERLKEPSHQMTEQFKDAKLLVIDEAQRIEDIGIKLKVIFDTLPKLKIIATGSSAFELSNIVNEPLTGRYFSYSMYPISVTEARGSNLFELNDFLVYGSYPEVVTAKEIGLKQSIIQNIASNYLFKDILNIEYIKNARSLELLLRALALQIGSEVSLTELSNSLDLDTKTVARYLDILEKLYIIFSLRPYFTNKRKSITKLKKYYFYDLGIRNAVVGDFSPVAGRTDLGALWENFCILERMKFNAARGKFVEYYFWRSYQGDEIDLIEKANLNIQGFECKWGNREASLKVKSIYAKDLQGQGELVTISPRNFTNFV